MTLRCKIECNARYYTRHRDERLKYKKDHNRDQKLLVLSRYGGCCIVCGITDPAFLTIDHIDEGGNNHRRNVESDARHLYSWLIRNDFPPGFQVLCWNHNWLKHIGAAASSSRYSTRRRAVKRLVVDYYGGLCQCCGEADINILTLDHVHGGGRRNKSGSGAKFYQYLLRDGFPTDLRVLCFNCNSGRQANGGVCPHKVKS